MRLPRTLLALVTLALGRVACSAPADAPGNAVASPYKHFLFVRYNTATRPRTSTLVMATVRPDGFDLRDVWTNSRLSNAELLCVLNGKVYLYLSGDLLCIDIEGGRCTSIRRDVGHYSYSHVDGWVFCVAAGRLHGLDLRREVCRPIVAMEGGSGSRFAASPGATRIALFTPASRALDEGYRLNIVDVKDGARMVLPGTHPFVLSAVSSSGAKPCPFAWLDDRRVLFVRSVRVPAGATAGEPVHPLDRAVHWAAVADITTGQTRQVAALPGAANSSHVSVRPARAGVPALIDLTHRGEIYYSVDLQNSKLVERNVLPAGLSLRGGFRTKELRHGTKLLGQTSGRGDLAVSSDQKQVVWVGPLDLGLKHCDLEQGDVRTVGEGRYASGLLWFTDEALTPRARPATVPDGWQPFEHSEYPREAPPKTWPSISDYLTLTLSCDKQVYAQHEPVQFTITLANKSDVEFQAVRPRIDGHLYSVGMDFPGGSKLVSAYCPDPPESVVLRPGSQLASTVTLETRGPGEYSLDAKLSAHSGAVKAAVRPQGWLFAESVEFTVERTHTEAELLDTKMKRLLDIVRAQRTRAPGWNSVVGDLADVGPVVTPYLIAALGDDLPALVRTRLLWALNRVATPEALPVYKELLESDDAAMQKLAVAGLAGLWSRKPTAEAADHALDVLIVSLLTGKSEALRRETAKQLARLHSQEVRDAFEEAVTRDDDDVAKIAGPYLIAWEETALADWLAAAIREPTHARLASARVVIDDLRQAHHADKMPHLGELTWEQVSEEVERRAEFETTLQAWEAWARENPRASEGYFERVRKPWRGR